MAERHYYTLPPDDGSVLDSVDECDVCGNSGFGLNWIAEFGSGVVDRELCLECVYNAAQRLNIPSDSVVEKEKEKENGK